MGCMCNKSTHTQGVPKFLRIHISRYLCGLYFVCTFAIGVSHIQPHRTWSDWHGWSSEIHNHRWWQTSAISNSNFVQQKYAFYYVFRFLAFYSFQFGNFQGKETGFVFSSPLYCILIQMLLYSLKYILYALNSVSLYVNAELVWSVSLDNVLKIWFHYLLFSAVIVTLHHLYHEVFFCILLF